VIFFHTPEQKAAAEAVIRALTEAKTFNRPIVTEVAPAPKFYQAEQYHQEYFERNPRQPYCHYVVSPKVAKFRKQFAERLKK
jgi:peptide-methionine (S)-S-oxide reductase